MSKADTVAFKYAKENGTLGLDYNQIYDAVKYGYHQAEKDLKLTWEDISKIISIDQHVCGIIGISNYTHNHQQAMEEVLKRFQDLKK